MSRLIRFIALAVLLMAVAVPNAATAAESRNTLGKRLVNRYLSDLQRKNVADLRAFLSTAFQVQRSDGSPQTKAGILRNPPTVGSYTIRRLRVTGDANVLVATFQADVREVINGQPLRTGYSPRLATFIHGTRGWQIIAYANFNRPI